MTVPVKLTADLVESFAGTFLSPRYDQARPTPQFHREAWTLYTSDAVQCMVVAPRDHAKSTGLTFDYILAEVLFRVSDYVILVGSTEDGAVEQLGNIKEELLENEDLIKHFHIQCFESESKSDIIVRMQDGHRFRILARGAEQRIRGRLWKGKRPNLLVCDDMEDDEQVENADRRVKFRRWFFRAAKQALSKSGKIRVHGTILHDDSLLSRLRRNRTWKHLFYKAHLGFDDFSEILWPERWSEQQLRDRRQEFIEDGDSAGYSQEFLNDPLDHSDAFLKKVDFLPMRDEDYDAEKVVCIASDFAVSKADKANRTSFTVGGKDVNNILHFIDQRVGRWDPQEWIEEMFSLQKRYNPEVFWVEDGVIWKAVKSMIYREMLVRDITINFEAVPSVKDKGTRGRSYQRRMRAGQCRFDKRSEWYPGFEAENLRFTGSAAATLDDQFDSAALLSRGFDTFTHVEKEDFFDDEEWALEEGFHRRKQTAAHGRSLVTGY
tara:strand:- start:1493 stop:2968 length:1476 start_codon:yes stop_codon:yes gene_type:complete